MPIVRVQMFVGRSVEEKRALVEGITATVARVCHVDSQGVHVLIEEMTRENWGRGAVLHVDRPQGAAAGVPVQHMTGEPVVVVEAELKALSGAVGSLLGPAPAHAHAGLRGLVTASQLGVERAGLAFITWVPESADSLEDVALEDASSPGSRLGTIICARIELPHGGGLRGMPRVARFMTVSTHEVVPDRVEEYLELRRIAVHPGMARCAGFISSDLLQMRDRPNAFFVVNQWMSKPHADGYSSGPLHDELRAGVRPLLLSHSGTREFDVLPLSASRSLGAS